MSQYTKRSAGDGTSDFILKDAQDIVEKALGSHPQLFACSDTSTIMAYAESCLETEWVLELLVIIRKAYLKLS